MQEALQNAVKHSRVKEAEVDLEYGEWGVRLTVSDHGVGIDPRLRQATDSGWSASRSGRDW